MTIRVNDVIVTSIAGRKVRSVRTRTIWSGADTWPTPSTVRSSWFGWAADTPTEHDARRARRRAPPAASRFIGPPRLLCVARPSTSPKAGFWPSSVTSETLTGDAPSSNRRPSTLTMSSDRRSPIGSTVSTGWGRPSPASARRACLVAPGARGRPASPQHDDSAISPCHHSPVLSGMGSACASSSEAVTCCPSGEPLGDLGEADARCCPRPPRSRPRATRTPLTIICRSSPADWWRRIDAAAARAPGRGAPRCCRCRARR